MFLTEHYTHEIYTSPIGTIMMIDVADTWDCDWEGAYAIFDEEVFRKWWEENAEDEDGAGYTFEDIEECGEMAGAFDGWEVVSSHHRKPEVALRNLMKAVKRI